MHVFSIPFSVSTVQASDGWPLSLIHWKGGEGGRPVLILPGRAEPAAKYGRPAARMMERGCDVWTLDWRGQGLSGWAHAPAPARRGHVESFDRLADDVVEVLPHIGGSSPATAPLVVAHSMGGALLLRTWQRHPTVAQQMAGAFMTGPMIAIPTGRWPVRMARWMARAAVRLGRGQRYAAGQSDWTPSDDATTARHRTSSVDAFEDEQHLLRDFPELQVGGPTWGWVDGALRLCDALWQPTQWPDLPVRVLVGAHDAYVRCAVHQVFFGRFPSSQVIRVANGYHELMHETPAVQAIVWRAFDDLCKTVDQATDTRAAPCGAQQDAAPENGEEPIA